jgi:hypothetical protein
MGEDIISSFVNPSLTIGKIFYLVISADFSVQIEEMFSKRQVHMINIFQLILVL